MNRQVAPALLVFSIVFLVFGTPSRALAQSIKNGVNANTIFRQFLFEAEDSRAVDPKAFATLRAGMESADDDLRLIAIRAFGRLERSESVRLLINSIADESAEIRAEVANALGQSVESISEPTGGERAELSVIATVHAALTSRLYKETDSKVRAVLAQTLGRLSFRNTQSIAAAEQPLSALLDMRDVESLHTLLGVVDGLESLTRQNVGRHSLMSETVEGLRSIVIGPMPVLENAQDQDTLARVRRLAMSTLAINGTVDRTIVESALSDIDPQVRRLAATALGTADALNDRAALIMAALNDSVAMVRYEALRAYGGRLQSNGCQPIIDILNTGDGNMHLSLLALDLLANECPPDQSVALILASVAGELTSNQTFSSWHRPAHALVSLASVAPDRAKSLLPQFSKHQIWQVRSYAARAAAILAASDWLLVLANDSHPNVRTLAVRGLAQIEEYTADEVYLEALESSDYQLILTAARALEGSPDRRVTQTLITTLARLTAENSDTSRDPRVAILERLHELGSRRNAGVLRPYLEDFDTRVSNLAAEVLTTWTDQLHEPASVQMRTGDTPLLEPTYRIQHARIEMSNGGVFHLTMHPREAPATVARFARLSREGYYDGLMFHRVVPNFVIQGGSPGANEFAGDDRYLRDEVGLRPHVRGAVGISTRGRDTGDAQIFINLVDNPRLDHNYTVFATVASGMDVVDQIIEGDVMQRITISEQ